MFLEPLQFNFKVASLPNSNSQPYLDQEQVRPHRLSITLIAMI
jgi:hypothetical protein